jgi:phosphoribosyl 1,2-cyclic phosphate phosphodiesterase
MKITVLGCGTSGGVPQIGCDCDVCRSTDPRDKRRRCSIFLEAGGQKILVDTGPDLRQQCLDAGISAIDALLYTHAHADHVHGIDELRAINNVIMAPVQAYAHERVFERIRSRFAYAFEGGRSEFGFWRPEIAPHAIDAQPFELGGVEVRPFRQKHGRGESWGFRLGRFAYSSDTDGLDETAFETLRGVDIWIVDCLRERPHPSHAHRERTLAWIERLAPAQAFLTHMNHELSYRDWVERLPPNVLPAHDGLVLEVED